MGASPRVVDWNNDGKKDLLVGDVAGTITIYINTNTDSNPMFTKQGVVMVGGTNFITNGGSAEPFPVDWNNDGKVDVVCGGSDGLLYLLINEGTALVPVFNRSVYIQSGGVDIGTDSAKSKPCVADWNSDGKKDLLVSFSGGWIYYYENVGTDSAPVFNGSSFLVVEGVELDRLSARCSVYDWDHDGTLDLIVGDGDGFLWFYRRTPLDSDSDGMDDWWENRYLPGGISSLPADDDDGDGLSNREEFRCQTDPADASSVLKMDGVTVSGSDTVINWTASTGVSYRVQSCSDLTAPVWSNVSALLNTGAYMVTPAQGHQYYRIVVP